MRGSIHHSACLFPAKVRPKLENLCCYVGRSPVAMERLPILSDGGVKYRLSHKWCNRATHVVFEPLDLIGKLAALFQPPRFNLVKCPGVFSPATGWRSHLVRFNPGESNPSGNSGGSAEKQGRNADG
jgi:hypothetical protein